LTKLLVTEPLWERTYHRASHACDDLPSHVEIDRRPRVCLGLDVSGSIRQEIREIFLGVSSKIETPVTAFALDTQMQGIWRNVSRNNWQQFADELPKRGGGTLFQPAIDFAASERASLVYLTDGETGEQSLAARGVPITWLIWGNQPARRVMQPVGRLIMVEVGA
jgi:predicted metal-dependent peptidase